MFETNDENKSFTRFLFKMADKDNSKGIDRREFKPLAMFYVESLFDSNQTKSSGEQKSEIDNQIDVIFEENDSGQKGFLNENEFSTAFQALINIET